MFLYLVRHAEAKNEIEDPLRGLSKKGFDDIERIARYVKGLNLKASRILHSNKKRALQTASVLSEHLNPEKGSSETDGLSPMDAPEIWFERLSAINEDIVLVGHLPHLGRLVSMLILGDKEKGLIDFNTAGIVCTKRSEDSRWTIQWVVNPDVIR